MRNWMKFLIKNLKKTDNEKTITIIISINDVCTRLSTYW